MNFPVIEAARALVSARANQAGSEAALDRLAAELSAYDELNDDQHAAYYRESAKEREEEGSLEIDDTAVLSPSEDGCYVQAWIWVDAPVHNEG